MNIRIGDYQLTSDTYGITVERKYINQKEGSKNFGKEISSHVGHWPKLDQACRGILNHKINKSDAQTIEELRNLITLSTAQIVRAVKSI